MLKASKIFCLILFVGNSFLLNAQKIGFSQSIGQSGFTVPAGKTLLIHSIKGNGGTIEQHDLKLNGTVYFNNTSGVGFVYASPIVAKSGTTVSSSKLLYVTGTLIDEANSTKREELVNRKFMIYPNPTNKIIYITSTASILPKSMIRLYDLNGKLLLQEKWLSKDDFALDVSYLEYGNYILKIGNDEASYRFQVF